MGASQSSMPEPQLSEKLAERLRAMQLEERLRALQLEKETGNDDYLMVEHGAAVQWQRRSRSEQNQISLAAADKWLSDVLADQKNRLAISALTSNSLASVLTRPNAVIRDTQNFNIRIPHEGSPVTNQRSSGRCWLFATTNVFRIPVMLKYNLDSFELSQSYLFFWDKLEKANYFLENVLDTLDESLDGRLMQALLASPVGDGGQWDMAVNLVQKYGLVPQTLYPDSFNAMNSSAMDSLITTLLRQDALRLRTLAAAASTTAAEIATIKDKMLREIHLVLTLMLGPPPSPQQDFTWDYTDKHGAFHSLTKTPTAFAAQLSDAKTVRACKGTDVHRLFSLVNDPRNAYHTLLGVERLGNVWGGRPVTYVNVSMDVMKQACIATLKAGIPVFFGSDVGKQSNSATGIMDTSLIDYEAGFNVRLGMSKAQRLQVGESAMTHAMVLTGVHVVDANGKSASCAGATGGKKGKASKSVRWRVENSWSESAGSKGYFVATDAWFDEWVYQAVVDPSFVSAEVRKVLEQKPKMLPLWDPMGALA